MKRALLLSCLLLISACKDITHVQTGYIGDRDECRANAESGVGVYTQPDAYPMNDKERNTALLQLFCECMKVKDWNVAGCPKAPPPLIAKSEPAPAPTVVVVQQPAGMPAILPAPAPAQGGGAGPAKPRGVCLQPKATCPAPNQYLGTSSGSSGTSAPTPVQSDQQLNGILQRQ
jgi:hypothetical protein